MVRFGEEYGSRAKNLEILSLPMTIFHMKSFLHVGCGHATKADVIGHFQTEEWREIRFDIDAAVKPDVVGSITDMSAVSSESVDAVYSANNLEHLYAHEVDGSLKEFLRVLQPAGFAVITCPDLQAVCARVAEGMLLEPAYSSRAGPIAAVDMIYG